MDSAGLLWTTNDFDNGASSNSSYKVEWVSQISVLDYLSASIGNQNKAWVYNEVVWRLAGRGSWSLRLGASVYTYSMPGPCKIFSPGDCSSWWFGSGLYFLFSEITLPDLPPPPPVGLELVYASVPFYNPNPLTEASHPAFGHTMLFEYAMCNQQEDPNQGLRNEWGIRLYDASYMSESSLIDWKNSFPNKIACLELETEPPVMLSLADVFPEINAITDLHIHAHRRLYFPSPQQVLVKVATLSEIQFPTTIRLLLDSFVLATETKSFYFDFQHTINFTAGTKQ